MRKLPSRKILACLVAGALFLPHTGFTLGLGEIEVNSVLNQKLNADIELLSATPEDAETIIVKLASRQEFLRAGLDRPYSLNNLHFKAEIINDIPYIKVSSGVPIREPYLNFLIEVDWPKGHLLREYTVLLDPPVFMTQSASTAPVTTTDNSEFRPTSTGSTNVVPVVAPASTVAGSFRPTPEQTAVSQPQAYDSGISQTSTFIPAPVVQQQTSINQPAGSYRIKTGDTAWSLANAMRPDQSISVQQMMIAMLRANPESFIDENVNGLKRGYILRMPDYDQIAAINDEDARALVREQAVLWRQYQQSKAGGQVVSAMQTDGTASSEGDAESGAEIAGKNAYLEIVSAGSGTSTNSGKDPAKMTAQELRAELALARERVETERVEKEALQQRVDVLERHVEQMKGMLSIEDEELSRVQSLNLPADEDTAETAADTGMTDEVTADTESMEPEAAEVEIDELFEGGAEAGASEEAEIDEVFIGEATEQAAGEEQPDESMAEMPESSAPATADATSEPKLGNNPPTDLLTQLLNDPVRLAAAGGGLLLIAALIGIIVKRRKTASASVTANAFEDLEVLSDNAREEATDAAGQEESILESLADEQISDFGIETSDDEFGIASSEETKIDEAETSASAEESIPRDDVIAEADVYLAYGIYQQAEELLIHAISENPDRNDYRIKLAETHYASKNPDAFIETATEIKKYVDSDDSPEWKKVVVMGQDMCPENSMFQGGMIDDFDVDALTPQTPSMDDENTAISSELDDLGLDDESLELPDLDETVLDTGAIDVAADSEKIPEIEEQTVSLDMSSETADEIEFDLSDNTAAVEKTSVEEDGLSLDIALSELGTEREIENEIEAKEDSLDTDDVVYDSSADVEMNFTMDNDADTAVSVAEEAETESAAEAEEEVILDLSDEIDVDSLDMDEIEDVNTVASDAFDDEDDFDLSSLGDVDEISTKLDLARAYLDMGDNEGTRSILEEVLADGNDEQKQEANDLMAQLG